MMVGGASAFGAAAPSLHIGLCYRLLALSNLSDPSEALKYRSCHYIKCWMPSIYPYIGLAGCGVCARGEERVAANHETKSASVGAQCVVVFGY